MAIFYTNWATGNDTTGNGSWANPYKSMWKASSVVSANNDEIRIAGSDWTDLPGNLTFAQGNSSITTSQNLTSFFPELTSSAGNAKVVITVDDEFGFFKSVFTVVAVTSTTLLLASAWVGKSQTYSGKRITTQHYYITSAPTSPSGVANTIDGFNYTNALNYTGLQITGGWTADGVQGGQTAIVMAAGGGTTTLYRFFSEATTSSTSSPVSTWFWSGFICANIVSFNNNDAYGQMGNFWFIRSTNQFGVSNAIMWNKPGVDANFYMYDCSGGTTGRWLGEGTAQTGFVSNIWHSYSTISNGNQSFCGNGQKFNNYYLRGVNATSTNILGGTAGYFTQSSYSRKTEINNFYFYKSNTSTNLYFIIIGTSANTFDLFTINKVYLPDPGTQQGVYLAYANNGVNRGPLMQTWKLGDGTQTLDELGIGCMGNTFGGTFNPTIITNPGFIVNSSQGVYRWVANANNDAVSMLIAESSDFVTGTNSLKLIRNKINQGLSPGGFYRVPIAVLPNITTPKTITIKAKATAAAVGNYEISLQAIAQLGFGLGPSLTIFEYLPGGIDLTTSFQDFTFNVTPSTWPTAYVFKQDNFYLYIGYTNGNSFVDGIIIDSITLS